TRGWLDSAFDDLGLDRQHRGAEFARVLHARFSAGAVHPHDRPLWRRRRSQDSMISVTLLFIIPLGASLLSLGLRTPKALYRVNFAAMTLLGGAQALLMSRVLRDGSFLAYDDLVHVDALA